MNKLLDDDLSFLNELDQNNSSEPTNSVEPDKEGFLKSELEDENTNLSSLKLYKTKEDVLSLIFNNWKVKGNQNTEIFQKNLLQKENVLKSIINDWKV